jgi:hypothetical protein
MHSVLAQHASAGVADAARAPPGSLTPGRPLTRHGSDRKQVASLGSMTGRSRPHLGAPGSGPGSGKKGTKPPLDTGPLLQGDLLSCER